MSYLSKLNEMTSSTKPNQGGGMHSHPAGMFVGVIDEIKVKNTNTGKRIFEIWGHTHEHGIVPPYSIWDIGENDVAMAMQDDHRMQQLQTAVAKTKSIFVAANAASEDEVGSWAWNDNANPAVIQSLAKLQGQTVTFAVQASKKEPGKKVTYINAAPENAVPKQMSQPVSMTQATNTPLNQPPPVSAPQQKQVVGGYQTPGSGVNIDDVPF